MSIVLRGLREGDGAPLAVCWKELWDLHESWGGYTTDRDARAFDRVADRLDRDAVARRSEVAYGSHLHLVAEVDGRVVGQVEGWLDRMGVHPRTKTVCEIRSLVVRSDVRNLGVARKLLDRLALEADRAAHESCVAIAEVLEANPAMSFYEKLGFRPVAWTKRLTGTSFHEIELKLGDAPARATVRRSRAGDENAIARLEARLAERRRRGNDARYDPPQPLEAAWLGLLRDVLTTEDPLTPQPFVAATPDGNALATAQFWMQELEPPFFPQARAIASRLECFDNDEAYRTAQLLCRGLLRLARRAGASAIEFVDLPPPAARLSQALESMGIPAWSRIMQRP